MLSLLPEDVLGSDLKQCLIFEKRKIDRLCGNGICIESYACNHNDYCRLILYKRPPLSLRVNYEAGILYSYGNRCENWRDFPIEMLRFFSEKENDCFDLANEYYNDLVEEQGFIKCQ